MMSIQNSIVCICAGSAFVFGCSRSTDSAPSAVGLAARTNTPAALYVHFGLESADSTRRLLSARIYLGEAILVGGEDYWQLTGRIEQRGTNLFAALQGETGAQGQSFTGNVTLEEPFYGQQGIASGVVVPIWFAISTNSESQQVLERIKLMTKQRLERVR